MWGRGQGCAGSRKRESEEGGVFIQKLVLVKSKKVFKVLHFGIRGLY